MKHHSSFAWPKMNTLLLLLMLQPLMLQLAAAESPSMPKIHPAPSSVLLQPEGWRTEVVATSAIVLDLPLLSKSKEIANVCHELDNPPRGSARAMAQIQKLAAEAAGYCRREMGNFHNAVTLFNLHSSSSATIHTRRADTPDPHSRQGKFFNSFVLNRVNTFDLNQAEVASYTPRPEIHLLDNVVTMPTPTFKALKDRLDQATATNANKRVKRRAGAGAFLSLLPMMQMMSQQRQPPPPQYHYPPPPAPTPAPTPSPEMLKLQLLQSLPVEERLRHLHLLGPTPPPPTAPTPMPDYEYTPFMTSEGLALPVEAVYDYSYDDYEAAPPPPPADDDIHDLDPVPDQPTPMPIHDIVDYAVLPEDNLPPPATRQGRSNPAWSKTLPHPRRRPSTVSAAATDRPFATRAQSQQSLNIPVTWRDCVGVTCDLARRAGQRTGQRVVANTRAAGTAARHGATKAAQLARTAATNSAAATRRGVAAGRQTATRLGQSAAKTASRAQQQVSKAAAAAATRGSAAATRARTGLSAAAKAAAKKLPRRRSKRSLSEDMSRADSNLAQARETRQALAAAGLALGGYTLMGAISNWFNPSSSVSKADLMHIVDATAEHFDQEDAELDIIRMTVNETIAKLSSAEKDVIYVTAYIAMIDNYSAYIQHFAEMTKAIETLLQRHLSPSLLDPDLLRTKFNEVVEEMHSKGLEPVMNSPLELFTTDVGHTWDAQTLKLTIIIGVPATPIGSEEELKRILPFPIALDTSNGTTFVTPHLDNELVAIHQPDRSPPSYRSIPASDVFTCPLKGSLRLCRPSPIPRGRDQCLNELMSISALDPKATGVLQECRLKLANATSTAVRTSPLTFRVYLATPTHVTAKCGSRSKDLGEHIGLQEVTLTPNCTVRAAGYLLKPLPHLEQHHANIELKELHLQTESNFENELKAWKELQTSRSNVRTPTTLETAMRWKEREDRLLRSDSVSVRGVTLVVVSIALVVIMALGIRFLGWSPVSCLAVSLGAFVGCCCKNPCQQGRSSARAPDVVRGQDEEVALQETTAIRATEGQ